MNTQRNCSCCNTTWIVDSTMTTTGKHIYRCVACGTEWVACFDGQFQPIIEHITLDAASCRDLREQRG